MAQQSERSVPSRFRTLVIDPPWPIDQSGARGADRHYPLMSVQRIKALPIADLAEDDAHLWLWTTNGTIRLGYELAEAWGFTVRSVDVDQVPAWSRQLSAERIGTSVAGHAWPGTSELPVATDVVHRASSGSLAQAGGSIRDHRAAFSGTVPGAVRPPASAE